MTFKGRAIAITGAIGLASLFFNPILPPAQSSPQPGLVAFQGIKVGMTQAAVLKRLGQPSQKQGQFWVWFTRTSAYGVTFKDGRVLRHGALQG